MTCLCLTTTINLQHLLTVIHRHKLTPIKWCGPARRKNGPLMTPAEQRAISSTSIQIMQRQD